MSTVCTLGLVSLHDQMQGGTLSNVADMKYNITIAFYIIKLCVILIESLIYYKQILHWVDQHVSKFYKFVSYCTGRALWKRESAITLILPPKKINILNAYYQQEKR
jgi:hypothetical protein